MSDTASHQFCHVDGYGVKPKRKGKSWACIGGIVAEAGRSPGSHDHVGEPRAPRILHGISPVEAGRIAIGRAIFAVDSLGRKLRCDGVAMLAVVCSYPLPRSKVEAPRAVQDRVIYEDWRDRTVSWLLEQFGHALLSVVEHFDEGFLHVHGFAVPDIAANGRLQLEVIHYGRAAVDRVAQESGGKKKERVAYVEAMSKFQDAYHASVSARFGHLRYGKKRERRNRPLHLAIRRAEERQQEIDAQLAAERQAIANERLEAIAAVRAEIEEERRAEILLIHNDAENERRSMKQQMLEKDTTLDKAVATIVSLSRASQNHQAKNARLEEEVERLKAIIKEQEIENSGASLRI